MVEFFREKRSERVEAEPLDEEKIEALGSDTRRQIFRALAEEPSYPAAVAEKLGIGKQKAYYHFRKLQDAGLVEKDRVEEKSGGTATYYRTSAAGYLMDLGTGGEKAFVPPADPAVENFLHPLVDEGELDGEIIVGSPDQHGPDQVRARDGHLAGDLGVKLGNYSRSGSTVTRLDTELVRGQDFERNLVLLGGVLTNTVTKKFNEQFPARFSGEDFPYHRIETPENSYTEDAVGVIAKTSHPEEPGKALYLVAGVRHQGTEAAVRAFKNLETVIDDYREGEFYAVVRGLDLDGDGEIDDYEMIE